MIENRQNIAVITSVHYPALEPRIYYKQILSLAQRYTVHYLFPDDGNQEMPDNPNVVNHPIPVAKNRLNRLLVQINVLKIK